MDACLPTLIGTNLQKHTRIEKTIAIETFYEKIRVFCERGMRKSLSIERLVCQNFAIGIDIF